MVQAMVEIYTEGPGPSKQMVRMDLISGKSKSNRTIIIDGSMRLASH